MKLSILICTIVGREHLFGMLYHRIKSQGRFNDTINGCVDKQLGVEILFDKDNKEISIGAKRQRLLERATGKLVSYVDDDDLLANKYIYNILKATREDPKLDCIGFLIDCDMDGRHKRAIASLLYKQNQDNAYGYDYVRTIYHKTPVLREHALKIGFKDMRFGEDFEYASRLNKSGLLKREVFVNDNMYFYRYRTEPHGFKYGIK